jgi:hypothetical protein
MISNLVTFGDSWPAGTELKDKSRAFGYLLAKMLNTSAYKNCAIPATSNDRMIFQLQKYIQQCTIVADHVAIFFITSPSRHLQLDHANNIIELKVPPDWKTESDPFVANWYRYFQSDASDKFNLYKLLLSLQRICEQHHIQDYYVSGWTDINFEMPGVDTKKLFPRSCIEMFGSTNVMEFHDLDQNQYIYPNVSHPNEQGHAVIANHLYQWITSV